MTRGIQFLPQFVEENSELGCALDPESREFRSLGQFSHASLQYWLQREQFAALLQKHFQLRVWSFMDGIHTGGL